MSETVLIKVTVIGTVRPIVHPPSAEVAQAFARAARAIDHIGPSPAGALVALARTESRP